MQPRHRPEAGTTTPHERPQDSPTLPRPGVQEALPHDQRDQSQQLMERLMKETETSPEFLRIRDAIEQAADSFEHISDSDALWDAVESTTIQHVEYATITATHGKELGDAVQFYLEESALEAQNGGAALEQLDLARRRTHRALRASGADMKTTGPFEAVYPHQGDELDDEETISFPPHEFQLATFHSALQEAQQSTDYKPTHEVFTEAYQALMRVADSSSIDARTIIHDEFNALPKDQQLILKYIEQRQRSEHGLAVTPNETPSSLSFTPLPLLRTDAESLVKQRLRDLTMHELRAREFQAEDERRAQQNALARARNAALLEVARAEIGSPLRPKSEDSDSSTQSRPAHNSAA